VASGPAAAGPDDGRERVERGDGHGHGSRRLGLGGKTEEETEELMKQQGSWRGRERMGRALTIAISFCDECEWSGWPLWRGARTLASVREALTGDTPIGQNG